MSQMSHKSLIYSYLKKNQFIFFIKAYMDLINYAPAFQYTNFYDSISIYIKKFGLELGGANLVMELQI